MKPENIDLEVARAPKNEEHFSALQQKGNEIKQKVIDKSSKKTKSNFKLVEDFVKEAEKRNIPFALYVNPFGYDFDSAKEGRGFWRYHKFHGDNTPYSKEADECQRVPIYQFFKAVFCFFTVIHPTLSVLVGHKTKNESGDPVIKPLSMFSNGEEVKAKNDI